ncbi:hypothetical protein Tco_0407223 [Tanacetum coccineum]
MLHGILRLEEHPSVMMGFHRNIEGIRPHIRQILYWGIGEPIRAIRASNSAFVLVPWRWKLMDQVVEGEVLKNFPRFVDILVAEFAGGGAVNLTFKMKEDMDIVAEFCGPSRWKELSKESGSKILLCGDGSYWKAFKPIASFIAKGKLKQRQTLSFPIFTIKVK